MNAFTGNLRDFRPQPLKNIGLTKDEIDLLKEGLDRLREETQVFGVDMADDQTERIENVNMLNEIAKLEERLNAL